jgi:hypothetical protein
MLRCCPTQNVCVFEPGSLALAAYFLHSNLPLKRTKGFSCKKIKRFIKNHRHGLVDVAVEEIADPTLDFVNVNSHAVVDFLHHFIPLPAFSSVIVLYFMIIIITILV